MYCIYKFTFPNNKNYIGITKNFNRRMSQHKWCIEKNSTYKLYHAIRKYCWDNIIKEVIYSDLTKIEAVQLEMKLIEQFNSMKNGYNTSPGGNIPSSHGAETTRKNMQNPEFREKALSALHSQKSKNKQSVWMKSEAFSKLSSERGIKSIANGACKLPLIRKKVLCVETDEIFISVSVAAKHFNGHRTHLKEHINYPTKRKLFKGFHFIEAKI